MSDGEITQVLRVLLDLLYSILKTRFKKEDSKRLIYRDFLQISTTNIFKMNLKMTCRNALKL